MSTPLPVSVNFQSAGIIHEKQEPDLFTIAGRTKPGLPLGAAPSRLGDSAVTPAGETDVEWSADGLEHPNKDPNRTHASDAMRPRTKTRDIEYPPASAVLLDTAL